MNYQTITLPFKREIWEHKNSFFGVFIAFSAVLIFVGTIALIQLPGFNDGSFSYQADITINGSNFPIPTDQEGKADIDNAITSGLQYLVHAILYVFISLSTLVSCLYLLSSLYDDRKDRSIYFWKSLPVSETQVVLTKFLTGVYLVPIIALLIGLATALISMIILSVFIPLQVDYSVFKVLTTPELFNGIWQALKLIILTGIWVAPFCAWVLLCSAISKGSPFLWVLLPPTAIVMIEELFFRESMLWEILAQYVSIMLKATDFETGIKDIDLFQSIFTMPELYYGLIACAIMIAATIWCRNNRYEI